MFSFITSFSGKVEDTMNLRRICALLATFVLFAALPAFAQGSLGTIIGAVIDSRQITELMAKGRDVMALLQLLPGAVDDATGSETLGQFSLPTMGGVRPAYSALNIDGISGNTARGRTAESPINMDAIAEVKVLTNSYPAQYGTASGMVVNLVTKGGTRDFHGSAYYYNRNEAFNANT